MTTKTLPVKIHPWENNDSVYLSPEGNPCKFLRVENDMAILLCYRDSVNFPGEKCIVEIEVKVESWLDYFKPF